MTRIVKKPEERKSEIIKAARGLFQTKEYAKATMQDIMKALGIAKGTIYHYFKSKEELLEAVVDDIVSENIGKLQNILKNRKGNALEKMRILVEVGRMSKDDYQVLDQLHQPGNEALHVRLLAETLNKLAPLYAQLIRQGCKEKLFKTSAPLECAEFMLAGIQFLTDVGIYPWSKQELKRRQKAFPRLVEQQLSAKPGSFQFLLS